MTALRLGLSGRLGLSPLGRHRPSPFVPTRLPDLAFWFDAELSSYEGGIWSDLSGNDNHASQPSVSARPTQTADAVGRRLLQFDGVNDALLVADPPDLSNGVTFFVVYRVRTPVDFRGIFTASAATGTDHQQFFTLQYEQAVNQRLQLFGRSIQSNQLFATAVDSTLKQYALATLASNGITVELRDLTGVAIDSSSFAPFGTPAAMVLGARYNDGTAFRFGAVDIYEIGLFARELGPVERDLLDAYVQLRHGLVWEPRFIGNDLAWFHDVDDSSFVLSGGLVDQWQDLTSNGRHWTQSGSGRPLKTTDGNGRNVVQFDGIDDFMTLAGSLPALQPCSVGVVYRVRERGDFDGIQSAAPPAGTDHTDFWTFRNGSAGSLAMQLFGRSAETNELSLSRIDSGAAQVAVWTMGSGTAVLRDGAGSGTDSYGGSFGAPAEIVLAGRYEGAPFGFAAIDVLATIGATRALSAADQARLVAWANAKWSL